MFVVGYSEYLQKDCEKCKSGARVYIINHRISEYNTF